MRARDIMRRRVVTVKPDTTLSDAARLFASAGITGAPVVGPGRKLLGVVSQTDLLRRHEQHAANEVPAFYRDGERIALTTITEEPGAARVAEVMTPAALCAEEETPVDELARFMLARRVHRVIITKGQAIRGIVTTMDMLRLIAVEGVGGTDEGTTDLGVSGDGARARGARRGAGRRARARGTRGRGAHRSRRRVQGRARVPR